MIDRISHDLKEAFPDMSGFSPRNLKYMRKFAESWPDIDIVQRTVAQISWRTNITLLDKIKDLGIRLWYAEQTIKQGFGKDMLVFQIESKLHLREGQAVSNFKDALPPIDSDMATQSFKDPYIFDFLGSSDHMKEKELEQSLIDHIQKFLLMYLNVVNDTLCQPEDNQTIGLLLVKSKEKLVVEYSLSGVKNPIGVLNWESAITKSLPDSFKSSLPSIEELEAEFMEDEAK